VNSTGTTPAPAVGGRQVGQLLADRYRLAVSKGGDEVADVWHALDESTQKVVTLEILRHPANDAAKQRFLAEARRMAAIERPSVMRVATILDEGAETFIVFEHLIPLPVVLTGLTAVARDVRPATKAAAETTLTAVAGPSRAVAQDVVATEKAAATEQAPAIIELKSEREPSVPQLVAAATDLPETVRDATSSRLLADARGFIRDVVHDAGMDTIVADARSFIADARARAAHRFDMGSVTSIVSRATALTRRGSSRAAQRKSESAPNVGGSRPEPTLPNIALPNVSALTAGAVALLARVRGNRIVLGGAALIVLAVVVIASPLDDGIGSALRRGPTPSATVAPLGALVPAPFALPPLSAYGATFESQGPYPTTTPNGPVEWVVALRNTGSAGWHRGIEGAQAALMTPDGAGVSVQSTDYVAPGQVGWFVVRFKARAEIGTYTVQLLPRIDGRGLLPELGIFTVVTVAKNP
jgi:hypothetical protein